jgi:hypothetical protein
VQAAECEEFVVECLGVMGNLNVEDMDWERLVTQYKLLPWLREHLVQGTVINILLVFRFELLKNLSCKKKQKKN